MSTRLLRVSFTLQEVENSSSLVYFPFLGYKWSNVRVPVERPSPRRGHVVSRKKESSPRRRDPPRRGNVRLGELEDRKWGLSGPPRQGFY